MASRGKLPIKKDLTTKFLKHIEGKKLLSRQEILDFARRPELKKGEADLLNRLGKQVEGKIPAQEFADSMRRDLLELKPVKVRQTQFDAISIDGVRGRQFTRERRATQFRETGKNYEEVVFESPITTNGSSHFPNSKNYFAHARGDEVVEGGKKIWREQEIQSDLLQKGNLEQEMATQPTFIENLKNRIVETEEQIKQAKLEGARQGHIDFLQQRINELKSKTIPEAESTLQKLPQLFPFTNDRFGERIMRERIKEKASKGYEKYRLPTGETIGKIEGFAETERWRIDFGLDKIHENPPLNEKNMIVGKKIFSQDDPNNAWIITDILGDGRFKAVPKRNYDLAVKNYGGIEKMTPERYGEINSLYGETFDLTGKSNPQYRRYAAWNKFLKNKYNAKDVTDAQGNTWVDVDLKPEYKRLPIEAFGVVPIATSKKKEE